LLEAAVQELDARAQDVGEPDEQRHRQAALHELVDQALDVDAGLALTRRVTDQGPALADGEVPAAPLPDEVGLERIGDGPATQDVGALHLYADLAACGAQAQ